MITYLKLYNNNPELQTLEQFANFFKIKFTSEFTLDDFFNENKETIFNHLSNEQLQEIAKQKSKTIKELTVEDIDKNVTLPSPGYLFIQEKYVSYSLIAKNTNFQISKVDTIAFQDAQIQSVLNDDGNLKYGIKRLQPKCRVIGWFKSIYFDKKSNEQNSNLDDIYNLKQSFIDLSKYVISLSTNVGRGGGTFQISFPHIPLYNKESNYSMNNTLNEQGNSYAINKSKQVDKDVDNIKASLHSFDYFDWLIQANDLVFISFDGMDDLKDDNLSGNNFDMIGLIDSVSISKNANGQINVDISGRDLMKLLTDDSSIFFYQGVSAGDDKVFKGFDNTETVLHGGDKDSLMIYKGATMSANGTMRQLNGNINIFACEPNDFSIDFVLKTVVSHLANMTVVPDDLFISWGDKRTTFSMLQTKNV